MDVTSPFKVKRKRRPKGSIKQDRLPGPFSDTRKLATLDGRTLAGRVLNQTRADMFEHLGGCPTAPERLLIEAVAVKATRLFLMSYKTLEGGEINLDNDHHMTLAWLNSMRQDLTTLGLQKRIRDVTPSLADILKQHAEEDEK
jgi:hypothetical protein